MARYANRTTVTPERSRAEIERTLERYGANAFSYGWEEDDTGRMLAMVAFKLDGKSVRLLIPMPNQWDPEFSETPTGRDRSDSTRLAAYKTATRQRWRAVALWVKATLEAVDAGIVTFEEAFLAHFLLPDGRSVHQAAKPELDRVYAGGSAPNYLLLPSSAVEEP